MRRWPIVTTASLLAAGLVIAAVTAGTPAPALGTQIAEHRAEQLASSLTEMLRTDVNEARVASRLAAQALNDLSEQYGAAGIEYQTTALAWVGDAYSEGASIDVRFDVRVDPVPGLPLIGGNTGGEATVCWRYTVRQHTRTEVSRGRMPCPNSLAPEQPRPVASLPSVEIIDRLSRVLTGADLSTVRQTARNAFPESNMFVDVASSEGVIVVAVGTATTGDCVVAVRQPDGTITYPSFDARWSPPRGRDCSPALYTNPTP